MRTELVISNTSEGETEMEYPHPLMVQTQGISE